MARGRKTEDSRSVTQGAKSKQGKTRRARLEAEAEIRRQEAARERKQQTLIGVIVTVILVALIALGGFIYWNTHKPVKKESMAQAYQAVQQAKEKPSVANDKGGFLISKNGVGRPVKEAPTIEIYMDFMCPGCGALHRNLDSTLNEMLQAGQINLVFYPMTFMDRFSTDEYSTRTGTAAAYIAQNDPEHFLPFIANLYAKDFQPDESDYKPVSNDKIRQQAIKAGVSPALADQALKGHYKDWLKALDIYTPMRKELWNTSGQSKGQMTTPTILINGKFWDLGKLSMAKMDYQTGLLKALGLDATRVGQSDTIPAIGAKGSPRALD